MNQRSNPLTENGLKYIANTNSNQTNIKISTKIENFENDVILDLKKNTQNQKKNIFPTTKRKFRSISLKK